MSPDVIRVTLRLIDRGAIKAFADVHLQAAIGDVTLCGFRVVAPPEKAAWVGFPQSSYVKNGQTVTKPILDLTRSQEDLVRNAVLAAYRRALGEASFIPSVGHKAI